MSFLIEPRDLLKFNADLVLDCTFDLANPGYGRKVYREKHIPGAVFVDLNRDLSEAPSKRGRHPLPSREAFAEKARSWGLNSGSRVVCYDQDIGIFAARLWWMLRWIGHGSVQVLNGGSAAWGTAGGKTNRGQSKIPAKGNFVLSPSLTRLCHASELPDTNRVLLDARDADRFSGRDDPIDAVAGHIPGAINAPFIENISGGKFLPTDQLRNRFEALGVQGDTVCYCGSGVTAAHNILALLESGFAEPALYADSWSGWITDPLRPIETLTQ